MVQAELFRNNIIFIFIISFLVLIGLNTSTVQAAIDPQRTPGVFANPGLGLDNRGIYEVPYTTTSVKGNTIIQDYHYPPQRRLEYSPQISPHPYKSATPTHPYKSETTKHPYK